MTTEKTADMETVMKRIYGDKEVRERRLTQDKIDAFTKSYVQHCNITRAGKDLGISAQQAWNFFQRPDVQKTIQDEMAKRHTRTMLNMDKILRELYRK